MSKKIRHISLPSTILMFLLVALFPIAATMANAQPPPTEWEKTFGEYWYNEWAESVQQTSDGGYILAGVTQSQRVGYDVYLVKTDADGNLQWNKTFGGEYDDLGASVQQTTDGGYVIAGGYGGVDGESEDVYLVKTDSYGNLQWEKTFGGNDRDGAYSVQQTSDGGYIIAGYTYSYGAGSSDVYLVKTDAEGSLTWNKTYGDIDRDGGSSVQQSSDGGYIIVGGKWSASIVDPLGYPTSTILVLKTDSNGNLQWEYIHEGLWTWGNSVQQTSDGGYIIAGRDWTRFSPYPYGDFGATLVKIDVNGNPQWSKSYKGYGLAWAQSVQQTSDGGYIIAGYTQESHSGHADVYLLKTDVNGNLQWEKTFGTMDVPGWDDDWAFDVRQASDGGYIIAGGCGGGCEFPREYLRSQIYGGSEYDLYLIKLTPWATVGSIWTTDAEGDPKVRFSPGETVYVHWNADGLVNVTVHAPDGTTEQEWSYLPGSGVNSFVPSQVGCRYEIRCTGAETKTIAVGSIFVVPELPFLGSLLALVTMLSAALIMRKRRIQ